MRSKFLSAALMAVLVTVAGYNVYTSKQDSEMSDLAIANVEALAQNENELMIGCDNSSIVIICKRTCWSCYREYISIGGYGKQQDLEENANVVQFIIDFVYCGIFFVFTK